MGTWAREAEHPSQSAFLFSRDEARHPQIGGNLSPFGRVEVARVTCLSPLRDRRCERLQCHPCIAKTAVEVIALKCGGRVRYYNLYILSFAKARALQFRSQIVFDRLNPLDDWLKRDKEIRFPSILVPTSWLIPLSQVVRICSHRLVRRRPDACHWRSFVGEDSAVLASPLCVGFAGR